jgi:NitT/TauT family transport system permease protein
MRLQSPGQIARAVLGAPNLWDMVVFPLVLATLFAVAWGTHQMAAPYQLGEVIPISLAPGHLPEYALRTTLRMVAAMGLSLVFTFVYASIAAKYRRAEMIMIPVLDILQSVPILGFLSLTVMGFIRLFPGSLLGPEAAAIFAIFTSQAWNMTFSFYHSLRMIPHDLRWAADSFQLSMWQRFWKLEVPYGLPNLIWNAMMSMSGGWFFVVASEAISVSNQSILLPGIGSYISVAIAHKDLTAIGYAILTMLVVILIYDQFLFRPLVAWSEKFKFELSGGQELPRSLVLDLIQRSRWLPRLLALPAAVWELSLRLFRRLPAVPLSALAFGVRRRERLFNRVALLALGVGAVIAALALARFVLGNVSLREVGWVMVLGLITGLRVFILIVLATLVWVPVGVWIGMRPVLAARAQPIVLFLSAFPANLLFPLAVVVIARHHLNVEIWLSPLMILGTQWYILFNVIAGASSIPTDLKEAAANLGMAKWQLWRRLIIPAIFPAYITGGLTASGGAWNASVVTEVVNWGATTLSATGIGAYIAEQTTAGDHPRIALGIAVMSLYVVLLNRTLWSRLYGYAQQRLALE